MTSSNATLPEFGTWLERERAAPGNLNAPRILLLTQAFPPRTEIGAARWEGFAPFLSDAGWGLDVVIEHPKDLAQPDWGRYERVPANVRVAACERRRPSWHAALLKARSANIRTAASASSSLSATDTQVASGSSARDTIREALHFLVLAQQSRRLANDFTAIGNAIVDKRHQLVVSSGPGHYVHVAASRIARQHALPHVVDLRDPWARSFKASVVERMLPDSEMRSYEASTLANARLILTNTVSAQEALTERFPALRSRIRSIPNGADISPILKAEQSPALFQIAHCGSLYLDRDPRPFLRAVGRVRSRLNLGASDLRVVFMGPTVRIQGQSLTQLANDAGIGDLFDERPSGTRDQARQLLAESTMAVAFQGETRTQVPAKVFEYVAFPLWLLALVGSDSATAHMLQNSDAIVLDITDEDGAAREIEARVAEFRAGSVPRPVGYDGRFSRARQAERLIAEFRQLVA